MKWFFSIVIFLMSFCLYADTTSPQIIEAKFYLLNSVTSNDSGRIHYFGVVESTLPEDFWEDISASFDACALAQDISANDVYSHGKLNEAIKLPDGTILQPKEGRYFISFDFDFFKRFMRPENFLCDTWNKLLEVQGLVFYKKSLDNANYPYRAKIEKVIIPKKELLIGSQIIGYNFKFHQITEDGYSKKCQYSHLNPSSGCFTLEVFTKNPTYLSSKTNAESFINIKTNQPDNTDNYPDPIYKKETYKDAKMNADQIQFIKKEDVIRSLYLKKQFTLDQDSYFYYRFSDNPKLSHVTIKTSPSFESTYQAIFGKASSIKKVTGFTCNYTVEVPSQSSSCGYKSTKTFSSSEINGQYQLSFDHHVKDEEYRSETVKINPSTLYKPELASVKLFGKSYPINEFNEGKILNHKWQTFNPRSSHYCDVYVSHSLQCSWK